MRQGSIEHYVHRLFIATESSGEAASPCMDKEVLITRCL